MRDAAVCGGGAGAARGARRAWRLAVPEQAENGDPFRSRPSPFPIAHRHHLAQPDKPADSKEVAQA